MINFRFILLLNAAATTGGPHDTGFLDCRGLFLACFDDDSTLLFLQLAGVKEGDEVRIGAKVVFLLFSVLGEGRKVRRETHVVDVLLDFVKEIFDLVALGVWFHGSECATTTSFQIASSVIVCALFREVSCAHHDELDAAFSESVLCGAVTEVVCAVEGGDCWPAAEVGGVLIAILHELFHAETRSVGGTFFGSCPLGKQESVVTSTATDDVFDDGDEIRMDDFAFGETRVACAFRGNSDPSDLFVGV